MARHWDILRGWGPADPRNILKSETHGTLRAPLMSYLLELTDLNLYTYTLNLTVALEL